MDPTAPDDAPEPEATGAEPDAAAGDATTDAVAVVAPDPPRPRRTGLVVGAVIAALVVVAVVAIALLSGNDPSPEVATRDTPTSIAPTDRPATTISVQKLPPFSNDPTVACNVDGLLPFPASALTGPTGAEKGPSPAAAAFRADLDGPRSGFFDQSGQVKTWRLAYESEADALFIGGDGPQRVSQHYRFKDGSWAWAKFATCGSPTVSLPGMNFVALSLDDTHPVDGKTTKVHLHATELACNGGVPFTRDRIAGPQVHADADQVVISIAARKPTEPLSKSCVSTAPIDITVDLGEPLGDRKLLNGNRFPFRPLT